MQECAARQRVLIIDDEELICLTLSEYLIDCGYSTTVARNGIEGLESMAKQLPDAVLVDLRMPVMSGSDVIRTVSVRHPLVPIIVVSGAGGLKEAVDAMRMGAWDYIVKPVLDLSEVHATVDRCLKRARTMRSSEAYRSELEAVVAERTAELAASRDRLGAVLRAVVESFAGIADMHNSYTGRHQRRVALLAGRLGRCAGLDDTRLETLNTAALLHDIGHLAVPSQFFSKPGPLTETEWAFVRTHADMSCALLAEIPFEQPVMEIIAQHHERMDGSGYPRGLKGDALLLEARILAVADVMEAMLAHRPHRPAHSLAAVQQELEHGSGILYCPSVVAMAVVLLRTARSVDDLILGGAHAG